MLIKFDVSSKTGILVAKFAFTTANLKIETLRMRRRFARVLGLVGLYCFVFYGCIVVYPVLHKFALTRKLMMACTYKHVPLAIGQGFGIGYRQLKRTAPKTLITTNY